MHLLLVPAYAPRVEQEHSHQPLQLHQIPHVGPAQLEPTYDFQEQHQIVHVLCAQLAPFQHMQEHPYATIARRECSLQLLVNQIQHAFIAQTHHMPIPLAPAHAKHAKHVYQGNSYTPIAYQHKILSALHVVKEHTQQRITRLQTAQHAWLATLEHIPVRIHLHYALHAPLACMPTLAVCHIANCVQQASIVTPPPPLPVIQPCIARQAQQPRHHACKATTAATHPYESYAL